MEIFHSYFISLFYLKVFIVSLLLTSAFGENNTTFNPYSPLIPCRLLPDEFVTCEEPKFVSDSTQNFTEKFYCPKIAKVKYQYSSVNFVTVVCEVIDKSIECHGNRTFEKEGVPCVKYSGYCFVTILLQSVFLGCLGIDRFCLGHTGIAVGKLLTLGGLGLWWFIDIILLVTGTLVPADQTNWCTFY